MPEKNLTGATEARNALREAMPVADRLAYFDHAAVAPISGPAAELMQKWTQEASESLMPVYGNWVKGLEHTRTLAARLIGAKREEIALVPNTTSGIQLIAEGLDWQEGDNVVTLADEFPSNLFPWMNLASKGVEVREIQTDRGRVNPDDVREACDDQTRVVSVSWVAYSNGNRRDLAALADVAHSRGAFFFVDVIQGLGALPLDVANVPIDGLAADGHKWMLSPEGAGIAFIRSEWLDRLRPIGVGWHSVVHAGDYANHDFILKRAASRYEGGSHNMVGFLALGASLELLLTIGAEAISAAVLENATGVREALSSLGGEVYSWDTASESSGIVSCEFPGVDLGEVRKLCMQDGVILNQREGRLRVSPHAYCNGQDQQRLTDALKRALATARD